jgi:hypothetical protein
VIVQGEIFRRERRVTFINLCTDCVCIHARVSHVTCLHVFVTTLMALSVALSLTVGQDTARTSVQ